MKTIPHSQPTLGREEKKACAAVIDSLYLASGPIVAVFEKQFARMTHRKYAIAMSSGTAALAMVLKALNIGSRDRVAMPSYTCAALLHALDFVGARPVIADVSAEDMNLSAVDLKRRLTRKTVALIVPHVFGRAADIRSILKLGLPVIEDGTQALGAQAFGKPIGSFGVMSIFSFYATKMITTGEGGMIVTDSAVLARKLKDMRDYDKKETYRFRMNFKMSDLQAAVGIEQLKKLPAFIRARRTIAKSYSHAFNKTGLKLPVSSRERDHVYFRYVLRIPNGAAGLLRKLNRQGIEAKSPVFKPLHRYLGLPDRGYPETVRATREVCSLPIFPGLSQAAVRSVIQAILE